MGRTLGLYPTNVPGDLTSVAILAYDSPSLMIELDNMSMSARIVCLPLKREWLGESSPPGQVCLGVGDVCNHAGDNRPSFIFVFDVCY
jgi:hypothetical protein